MFFPIKHMPKLVFDHMEILKCAYQRLREKTVTDNIITHFLPTHFTLSELQKVYEIIVGHKVDKRNFRKDVEKKYPLKPIGKKEFDVTHRPAMLYKLV